MSYPTDITGESGLKFFGGISASISHELKNVLAIINENAGLLDDLTYMAQKGVPIDSLRLQSTAKRIQKQISRADDIIRNMNRFAHSIDTPRSTFDIHALMGSLIALTRKMPDLKGITVSLQPAPAPVTITTSPFFLQTLLWHVLSFAVGVAGDSKAVVMDVTESETGVRISFGHLDALSTDNADGFPGETETALISALGAHFSVDDKAGSIMLALPSGSSAGSVEK